MKTGKISESILHRSVLKQIKHRRKEVIVKPGVGEDCSYLKLEPDEILVLSTDPITGTTDQISKFAIQITANDIAAGGAEMIGVMLSILLPEETLESDLRILMQQIEAECALLNIEVLGGHTEVTKAVNQPIITVTGVGKARKENVVTTKGLQPGQDIVMTKWAGLEGTAILAMAKEEELVKRYTKSFIHEAKTFIDYLSIVPEASLATEYDVTSMHDITEGGVFGALWEMGRASNVGMEIQLKKILLRQETVEICEFFDLNPYLLMSSGCLLMGTFRGNELVSALQDRGISASIIGRAVKGNERVVINEEERRFLEPPKSDELYKVM